MNHLATLPNDYYKYITAACIQLSLKLYNTNYHKIKSCNDNNNNNNNYDNSSTVTDENNSNYNYDNHNSNTNNHRDGMYLVDLLNLDATELRYYERMVMFRTAMFISPLCTPIAFARLFIDCDKENFDGMHGHLLHVLGVVIGDFWNGKNYYYYCSLKYCIYP